MSVIVRHLSLALALGALLALGQPAVVHAQRPGPPPPGGRPGPPPGGWRGGPGGPDRMVERLARALNLSPTQKAKILPIAKAQGAKMQALWGDGKLSPQERSMKMRAMMQATMARVNAVLTPAQRKKFAAMRAQMRRGPRGPGGPGGPPPPGPPPM